jgi:hypothetical protein
VSQKLARAFVSEAISNSHAGIKACWLIVFSAGTYAALSTMKDVFIQMKLFHTTVSPDKQVVIDQDPAICFVLFAVFVLTFLRFYIGGVRVFDIRYSEIFKLVNTAMSDNSNDMASLRKLVRQSEIFQLVTTERQEDSDDLGSFKKRLASSDIFKPADNVSLEDQKDMDRFKRLVENSDKTIYKFEVVLLTFQTLIVVFLAFQIGAWQNFAKVYAFLLLWNVIYLGFNYVWSGVVIRPIFEEIFPATGNIGSVAAMFPMRASLVWIGNNLVCMFILLDVIFYSYPFIVDRPDVYAVFVCIVLSLNCAFDFILARDFYFPQFCEFLDTTIPTSPPSPQAHGKIQLTSPA